MERGDSHSIGSASFSSIDDREQGEAHVRQDIEPNRTLEAAAKAALRRQYAWKCERPRNCDERRQEIAIRECEERMRA